MIEPLTVSTDADRHAVFRAESLHLPGGHCQHHHSEEEHEERRNDFIQGMMSPRSVRELQSYLSSGGGKCLFNLPNTRTMYGGHRCGNGYLEDGEECDCGDEEECTSPCCNANNCTLKTGAECAHGVCCHNCKLKSPGVLCRGPSGSCDLPEYCDGKTESCPADFYLVDGTSCAGGRAYCYTGMCLTLEQQCRSLWGQDARPAPDLCFKRVNEAGDIYGNCGKDDVSFFLNSLHDRDAKCGKIQCSSAASKPIENNAVSIETTVKEGNSKITCRGTHVYKLGKEDEEPQGDTLDPGLVMTGTKCGEDSVRLVKMYQTEFPVVVRSAAKCHGHGLCNNNRNCHCDSGWAPPLCNQKGSGGSVDSGPVTSSSETHATKQDAASPHPSQSCPSWPKHAIAHPAGKLPPVPVGISPQARTLPVPVGQKPNHASPLPARPSPLCSLDPKNQSQPSAVPKHRPDPPKRPPPPCPVKKQSGVNASSSHS
uniref:ADAM metallopeptidase domain 19 n=1 Tax=Amphilophus citrinellus TaxID=61819 RepID=A0A3Q0SEN1_AMPCI